uniref:Uncharacterized protein n=1 Tax=Rhizophora mucronata TaxID=61149 RepID=A0A2P2QDB7_RHIMU
MDSSVLFGDFFLNWDGIFSFKLKSTTSSIVQGTTSGAR